MIGLDTNVLVRFLTQDDPVQGRLASEALGRLSRAEPGWIGREVLIELVWILERAYRMSRPEIADAIDRLLGAQELVIDAADRVGRAAARYRQGGARFADQMIALAGQEADCQRTLTFDWKAAGLPGMTLLEAASI